MASLVVCWNCSEKTEYGYCSNCGVEIVDTSVKPEEEVEERTSAVDVAKAFENTNSDYYSLIYVLVGINSLVFLITSILSSNVVLNDELWFLLGSSSFALEEGRYYVLVTSMFVHGDLLHIFFNMYWVGLLADRIGKFGYSNKGLYFSYFVTGILAGYMTTIVDPFSVGVGASGAVFGWIGLYIALLRRRKSSKWKDFTKYALFYIVISFFFPEISFWAHLFGFVFGFILGSMSAFDYFKKS